MHRALPGILVGGVVGSATRWAVLERSAAAEYPSTATLVVVNALGCFVLGVAMARWPDATDRWRLSIGVGFAGGLTTFSALAVDIAARLHQGDYAPIVASVPAQLLAGVVFFVIGRRITTT
ncbi:MAG: fluoride efflux transporter FluC [Acidimicrobiales bacterium]